MKIRELYHRGVLTAYPDETVAMVAGRMQQEAVGSLAVIEEGRLVGIVTERDLVRAASDGADPLGTRVGAYVTHGVAVADADEEASRVVRRMLNFGERACAWWLLWRLSPPVTQAMSRELYAVFSKFCEPRQWPRPLISGASTPT